jgi:hypothetical protein
LAEIIREPGKLHHIKFEDALVDRLLDHTSTGAALPMLAYTLRELYESSGKCGAIRVETYLSLSSPPTENPISSIIRRTADRVLRDCDLDEENRRLLIQTIARELVKISDTGVYLRRPTKWSKIPEHLRSPLMRFVNARLMVTAWNGKDDVLDIIHEALITSWPVLHEHLAAQKEFYTWLEKAEVEAQAWKSLPITKRDAALLTGLRLDQGLGWLETNAPRMPGYVRQYVEISAFTNKTAEIRVAILQRELNRHYLFFRISLALIVGLFCASAVQYINTSYKAIKALYDSGQGVSDSFLKGYISSRGGGGSAHGSDKRFPGDRGLPE